MDSFPYALNSGGSDGLSAGLLPQGALWQISSFVPTRYASRMARTPSVVRYRVRNWRTYNRALINRGRLTVWLDDHAIAAWRPSSSRCPTKILQLWSTCWRPCVRPGCSKRYCWRIHVGAVASAAKVEVRVAASGTSVIQATKRARLMATAISRCCRWVLACPM
jgi:hypothetical protein